MICFPNCKINIGLNIVEKRNDGFHAIESVFYPVGLVDALECVADDQKKGISFSTSGITIPGSPDVNLCVKAYHLIATGYSLPGVKAHLHKVIPIGAGLGGGSADAAFFIKLLSDLCELNLSWGEMHHYAKQLGSDCSFFISNRPAFVMGKGDEHEGIPIELNDYFIVIVYPGIHVSSAEAYSGVVPKTPSCNLKEIISTLPVESWKEYIQNDFETLIFKKFPVIKALKEKLYELGASYAAMSGSGSAVYGLFKEELDVNKYFHGYFTYAERLR